MSAMETDIPPVTGGRTDHRVESHNDHRYEEELDTETRRAFATTEFWLFLIVSVALLFFAYDAGHDSFTRDEGWRYVTWLAVAYFVSRGLAKAGSYESFRR